MSLCAYQMGLFQTSKKNVSIFFLPFRLSQTFFPLSRARDSGARACWTPRFHHPPSNS